MPIREIDYDPFAEQFVREKELQKRRNILEVDYDPFEGDSPAATPSKSEGRQPPAPAATLGGVASALGQGVAEGVTTALPSMAGEAMEFVGAELLGDTVEGIGRDLKEWADAKGKALYGPEKKRQGLERWVYEGSKMLAPSVIPAGVIGTGVRVLTKVGKLVKAGKAAQAAGDAVKAAEYFEAANKAASLSNNVASASTAGLFGASQAQSTRDTAEKTAAKLEAEGDIEGAEKARAAGQGWAPYASGAIEAGGEFFGTKYLGKLFRLDEAGVAKRGAKQLVSDFLKTLGVEVGTEIGQQGGEAYVEKVSGIRPDADPLAEALDVIGPTAFMTLLTGGAAGAVNRMRRDPSDSIDLMEEEKDQPDLTEPIKQAIQKAKKEEAKAKPRPSTAKEAAETFFGPEAVQNEQAIESLRRRGLYVPEDLPPVKSAEESAQAFEAEQARRQGEVLRAQAPPERFAQRIGPELGKRIPSIGQMSGGALSAPTPAAQEDENIPSLEPVSEIERIDQKANEAATSPLNEIPQPTEGQKEAGNYAKGHVKLHGLDISIENPRGSERSGTDKAGQPWSVVMEHPYGYIRGTQGRDKDHLDVFIGPDPESPKAFVVDQINPETGKWDEHKILMGFNTEEEARKGYLDNYQEGWKGLGAITEMPVDEFKAWAKSGPKTKPLSYSESKEEIKDASKVRSDEGQVLLGGKGKLEEEKPGQVTLGGEKAGAVRPGAGEGGQDLQQPAKAGGGTGERAGLTPPGKETDRDKAIAEYVEKIKEHSPNTAQSMADKIVAMIDAKDNVGLRDWMNGINPNINRLFTKLTGLPAKTQKDADASLRSMNPEKWDDAQTKKKERKAAEQEARAQKELDRTLEEQVNYNGKEIISRRALYDRLIADGYREIRGKKKGAVSEAWFVNPDTSTSMKIPKGHVEYVRAKIIEKGKLAAKPAEKVEEKPTFRQFIEAKGIAWPVKQSDPRYAELREEYDALMEIPQAVVDTLVADYNEGAAIGQYNDSDLEHPPTEKEIETAAVNVVRKEVENGNTETLREYQDQAGRGEAHREEDARTTETENLAQKEVTPETETTGTLTQSVIPGASFAETFDLLPAGGEIGAPAPTTAAGPRTATLEETAGETEAEKPEEPEPSKNMVVLNKTYKKWNDYAEKLSVDIYNAKKSKKPIKIFLPGYGAGDVWTNSLNEAEAWRDIIVRDKLPEIAKDIDRLEKAEVLSKKPFLAEDAVEKGKIEDFGEKIGGARKDTAERGYTMTGKAKKEEEAPAWRKKFVAMEKVHEPGKWVIGRTDAAKAGMISRYAGQVFSSKEEAEAAIPLYAVAQNHSAYQNDDKTYSIYKRVSDRKRLRVVNQNFPSREEAMTYMATHAEELLNTKTSFGEEILPVPEIAVRKGAERRTTDATPEMFMETFAPRGIEFGNWNNQEERQQVMNHAYDGLLDLADALGLPPKALMLNGDLAIAFGARGQGLTGVKAHYERDYGIINLTKMKGAGSLAHEWLHALDHYLGRQDTPKRGQREPNKRGDMVFPTSVSGKEYASSGLKITDSGVRKELKDSFESLLQSMYKRAEQYVDDTKKADQFLGTARKHLGDSLNNIRGDLVRDLTSFHKSKGGYSNKPIKFFEPASAEQLAEFDRLSSILVEGGDLETKYQASDKPGGWGGRHTNDTLESLNAIIKAARNHQGFNKEQTGPLDKVRAAMRTYAERIKMFEDAEKGTEKTRMRPTSYAIEARKMDQARTGEYWSEPREMAARAFSSYVEDKIAEKGGQSDFLVYHAHGGIILPMIDGFIARPYPEGAEREAINKEFDKFISTIQTRETPQGVEMYSVLEADQFSRQVDEFVSGKMLPGHTLDVGATPPVLRMLGAEQLPMVITQKNAEKILDSKHGLSADVLKQLPAQISDPIMVFESASQPDSLVVMTELKKDGKTIVAAIQLSRKVDRTEVHDIASVHPRESNTHFTNWINQGLLRYQNKQKSREWAMTSGLQLPKVRGPVQGFKNKILYGHDLVKWINEKTHLSVLSEFSGGHSAYFQEALDNAARSAEDLADVLQAPSFFDHVNDLLKIKSVSLPALLRKATDVVNRFASASESGVDSVRENAKALSDILQRHPLTDKPFGSLDAKTKRLMLSHVFRLSKNAEVLRSVVQLIPVDVMDNLGRIKMSPEYLFGNPSMIRAALSGNLGDKITSGIYSPDNFARTVALAGAEASARLARPDLIRPSQDRPTAETALNRNLSHADNDTRLPRKVKRSSVRDLHRRGLLKPAKLDDVKRFFPGQEVGNDRDGNIYVKTRGGAYVTIYKVDHIEANPDVLTVGYGTSKLAPGAVIPGAMGVKATGEYYIKLHRVYGDVWTMAHEGLGHFLEVSGIINDRDVDVLKSHIKNLHRDGRWDPANRKDIGGPEDRANFIADRLAIPEQRGPIGRIILRIRAFIDGILETFGVRSPESILRGIESGRIFERTGREGKASTQFDVAAQTDTKAFRDWFGKSKVVDAEGNPAVLYHSTVAEFTSFKRRQNDIGFHFGTAGQAEDRFNYKLERNPYGPSLYNVKHSTIPVYLSIKNPLRITDVGSFNSDNLPYALEKAGIPVDAINRAVISSRSESGRIAALRDLIVRKGYDGLVYKNEGETAGAAELREKASKARGIAVSNQIRRGRPANAYDAEDQKQPEYIAWMEAEEEYNQFRREHAEDSWVAFYPEQVKSAVANVGSFSPKNKDIRYAPAVGDQYFSVLTPLMDSITQPGILQRAWDEFRFQAQDKFHFLNKAQMEAERRSRAALPEAQDAYLAETRYHGMAAAAIEDFDEKHVDPLIELMSENDIDVEQADEYLHARHAREANARLRSINPDREDNQALSGMTDQEAEQILDRINRGPKAQVYKRIGRMVDAITKARRDLLIDAGLETEDTIAAWEEAYQYYVPLMREGKGEAMPRRGRGFEVRGGQKLRAGSTREVVNILANVVAQHEATIVRAEKAKVSRAFLEFAKSHKGPWKIDIPEKVASFDEDGLIQYRANPLGYMLAENVLTVRVDGKDHHITFDERDLDGMKILSALKNLDAADMGAVTRAVAKVSRWLAVINTSLNPEFIISNFARDIQTAAYNMADNEADAIRMKAIRQVGSAFKGIREYQDNNRNTEWAQWFNKFRNAGGQTGWIQSYETIQDREKALISKIEDMKHGKVRSVKRGLTAAFDYIADMNTAVENAVRLSVFKNLIEASVPESKAAKIAKELTVNFNRKGNMGPVLNAFYLFYNASIQGSARLIMAGAKSRKVRKFMAATVVFATLLDIMNRAVGGDDDDGENRYDKIAPWIKDRNMIIMLPGSNGYIQIPLPWGYNIFHVMGQAAGEVLTKKNNDTMKSALRVGGSIVSAFNPMGGESSLLQVVSPTIIDPFVQWAENKDWSGRKLRPAASPYAEKPSSQTYWHSARVPSKWIAKTLNELTGGDEVRPGKIDISPEAIDLAIDTVTGGAGKFISNLISTPIKYAKGEDVETYEIPFLRRIYGKAGKQVLTQQYYENMDAVRLVQRQLSHYKNDPAKVREIAKEYKAEVRLIGRMKATQKAMKDLKDQRQATEMIKDPDVRKTREKKIEETMEKIMGGFNKNYNSMKNKE